MTSAESISDFEAILQRYEVFENFLFTARVRIASASINCPRERRRIFNKETKEIFTSTFDSAPITASAALR